MFYKNIDLDDKLRNLNAIDVGKDLLGDKLKSQVNGTRAWAHCLWHNAGRPSMSFNKKLNLYHCFGCGKLGGPLMFIFNSYLVDPFVYLDKKLDFEKEDKDQFEILRDRLYSEIFRLGKYMWDFDNPTINTIDHKYQRLFYNKRHAEIYNRDNNF